MSVIPSTSSHHLLSSKHLTIASWALSSVTLSHNGGGVERHGFGLGFLTMNLLIAIETVDVIVWPIGKVGGIHLVFTFSAGEAFSVIGPWLCYLLLSFKHFALAARAGISLSFVTLQKGDISGLQVWL
jgi:hypothetical protein